MIRFVILLGALAASTSAPLGDLALPYDPAKWEVRVEGGAMNVTRLNGPERDHALTGRSMAGLTCTEEAMLDRVEVAPGFEGRTGREALPGGLTLVWATGDLGCRNLAEQPLAACVRHKGRAYLFETLAAGCKSGVGARETLPLLRGLEAR